jgi:hypothetical protein
VGLKRQSSGQPQGSGSLEPESTERRWWDFVCWHGKELSPESMVGLWGLWRGMENKRKDDSTVSSLETENRLDQSTGSLCFGKCVLSADQDVCTTDVVTSCSIFLGDNRAQ